MGGIGGRGGCARARDLGHRDRTAGKRGRGDRAQMPRRSRAGRVGIRLRRPSARRLARAGHGRLVQWPGLRAPALPRPPGPGGRRRAHDPRQRARTRAALAQPAARRCPPRCALARRHRARNGRARGRGDGAAHRNREPAAGRACRAQGRGIGVSRGRDRA